MTLANAKRFSLDEYHQLIDIIKIPLYAEAGIQNYWIFNLQDNQLETYSNPYQKVKGSFDYQQKIILLPNMTVNLPQFPALTLDLSQVFPN